LRARAVAVSQGDTLILTTDGVRGGFCATVAMDDAPQEIAESILARYAKGSDDAHVVVARYIGAVP
jgi:negative regulator of sigma-B (phosphoserine phosphatase)